MHYVPYIVHNVPYMVHNVPDIVHYVPYIVHYVPYIAWTDFPGGGGGGVWGGSYPTGSGKHPLRKFTDFQYSQLQFRLFHYDEIILTA